MVASWRTPECFPEAFVDRIFGPVGYRLAPRHEDCQGGYSLPGIFGGWRCPCPCHQDKP